MRKSAYRIFDIRAGWESNPSLIGRLSIPRIEDPSPDKSVFSRQLSVSPSGAGRSIAFQYDSAWLKNGFPIGSDLLFDGSIQKPIPGRRLFGFMTDRALSPRIFSLFHHPSYLDNRVPEDASPEEISVVSLVSPVDMAGGLLISEKDAPENAPLKRVQRITELDEVIYAMHAAERGKSRPEDRLLIARALTLPGRSPVLTVEKDGEAQTARIRSIADSVDRPLWLHIALQIARRCGIETADSCVEQEMGETVFFARRTDRLSENGTQARTKPLPVFSAATLVSAGKARNGRPLPVSYLGMADILNRDGAAPAKDLPEIWKRLVYRLMTGPSGDSARDWLFVRENLGWRLLPSHNLEWYPPSYTAASSSGITIDGRKRLSHPDEALSYAPYFGLTISDAKLILLDMMRTLSGWEDFAYDAGADPRDIALMAPLFDLL